MKPLKANKYFGFNPHPTCSIYPNTHRIKFGIFQDR